MSERKANGAGPDREAAPGEAAAGETGGRRGRQNGDREARLAAHLRENLKKRKALARARQQGGRDD